MVGRRRIGTAVACLVASQAGAQAPTPRLDGIGVQLFYATTGTLSENIAPPSRFQAHNSAVGEGDAKEPADDVLVTARLSVPADEASSATPLAIKVTDAKGKVVAQRTTKSLFFKGGRSVQALYLPGASCAGRLTVEARFGTQKKVVRVDLPCGE